MKRRDFIKKSASLTGGLVLTSLSSSLLSSCTNKLPFKISLAEWSLHRALQKKEIEHLNFAEIAQNDFGINAIEYVNSFFLIMQMI